MKRILPYLFLMAFPLIWIRFNAHSLLYLLEWVQDDVTLWRVYDSGLYEIIAISAFIIAIRAELWQLSLSAWVTGFYFMVTVILEWSGHNVMQDSIDNYLQILCAIISGGFYWWTWSRLKPVLKNPD